MNVRKQTFGKMADETPVDLYTLTNANGVEARIMTYGAIVVSLKVPDRNGRFEDVALGYDSLQDYVSNNPYFGAIIGRYCNRIAEGRFALNGVEYDIARNNGENHLHGGLKGFDKVLWKAREVIAIGGPALELTYLSEDGEEGYPGNLSVRVLYSVTDGDELKIDYLATTDRDTIINLTNHTYFNLEAGMSQDVLGHRMLINADRFNPVIEGLIPTGELRAVKGTPLDFTQQVAIGARVDQDYEQMGFAGGYDHNWVLNKKDGSLTLAARVSAPVSGRVMEVYTTEPGIQFYSGNFLDGTIRGKAGKVYNKHYGFCLEAQHFPDSPNRPEFPSTKLATGETYKQTTIYKFLVE